jgi:hypothetical protein
VDRPAKLQSYNLQRTRYRLLFCLVLMLSSLTACQYYQDYRNSKGEADIKQEKAEMMRAHRLCLQKYESDPAAQKERCGSYTQAIQEVEKHGGK